MDESVITGGAVILAALVTVFGSLLVALVRRLDRANRADHAHVVVELEALRSLVEHHAELWEDFNSRWRTLPPEINDSTALALRIHEHGERLSACERDILAITINREEL